MNLKTLQAVTLLTGTLTSGLIAGLMFAYACSVMPGLDRSSDRTFVETMRNINKAIINPWFMLPFVGSILIIALAAVLAWQGHGRAALPWIVAALALYLVAFAVTGAVNVPLNDRLERAGATDQARMLAAARAHFESRWVTWNIVRTLAHTAAFGCLAWALVVFGAHRDAEAAGRRPGGTAAVGQAPGAARPWPATGRSRPAGPGDGPMDQAPGSHPRHPANPSGPMDQPPGPRFHPGHPAGG